MAAPGRPGSCIKGTKVTSAELASPDHVIRLYYELYCHAVRTWKLWSLPLSWFVYEKNRLDLISPRVLKITVTHAVCTWRYWTLPLLHFERERIQLVNEFILLNNILRNRLFSEHMQWNYASVTFTSNRLMSTSSKKHQQTAKILYTWPLIPSSFSPLKQSHIHLTHDHGIFRHCMTSSLTLNNWGQKYCQTLGYKPNPSIHIVI